MDIEPAGATGHQLVHAAVDRPSGAVRVDERLNALFSNELSKSRSNIMAPYEDGLTFSTAPEVTRSSVRYQNRYGIEIAADLYLPKRLDESAKHPAIVIGPPYGGVKEQGPGVYGNELARRGFVAVAFDPSYNGESGGEPRHVSSPDIFAEDFSAGVDYLGTLPFVDRERIGAIGICGSGDSH